MARRGREVDPDFATTELLYRRCVENDINPNRPEQLLPDQISFYPDWSVNRSKYDEGHWEDVLYVAYPNNLDCRVAAISVGAVPQEIASEGAGGSTYRWRVMHRPEETNYCHSEIWTFKEGIHIPNDNSPNVKLPPKVKKRFRIILSEQARISRKARLGEVAYSTTPRFWPAARPPRVSPPPSLTR